LAKNHETLEAENIVGECLTYMPWVYQGAAVALTCVSLLESFPNDILIPTLVCPKALRPISSSINLKETIPFPLRGYLLWRIAERLRAPLLNTYFSRMIRNADPTKTLAYFWPEPSASLVQLARDRGMITVREMINTVMAYTKPILDEAYERLGLPPNHNITQERIDRELYELSFYDFIFAPNPWVEKSLVKVGIDPARILRSSFGWSPSRYAKSAKEEHRSCFRVLFVGSICVRKGVPQLLAAWNKSGVKGELLLAGKVEAALEPLIKSYVDTGSVRTLGYISDVGALYKSADMFVFPTLEEGGPQVTYEAAGCGLPIITTPMGMANVIKNGVNGIVVEPYDVDGLADAIALLARSMELRTRFAAQAKTDVDQFTYNNVGIERARMLKALLQARSLR
jgi:glycosyltransferase involved in cell wall biosynthesis